MTQICGYVSAWSEFRFSKLVSYATHWNVHVIPFDVSIV